MSKLSRQLPDGPPPDDMTRVLEAVQLIMFGKTATDAVRTRTCLECGATGIKDSSFIDKAGIRAFFYLGVCQDCQTKMVIEQAGLIAFLIWLSEMPDEGRQ